jgi:outer membrane immunogenic protein
MWPDYNTFRHSRMLPCLHEGRGFVGLAMRRLFFVGVALVALGAPAVAADLQQPPPPPVYKAPLLPAAYDWSGFYIGPFGSYSWANNRTVTTNTATGAVFTPVTVNNSAGHGGGQIGADYMFPSRIVLGAVGDISTGESHSSTNVDPSGAVSTSESRAFISGTIRGRLGYAIDRVLLYGTGGWAWVDSQASRSQLTGTVGNAGPGTVETVNGFNTGWTAGGGIAWAFAQNWNLFAEYRYSNFNNSVTFPIAQRSVSSSIGTNAVLAGLNLKLDGAPAGCPWYQRSC